MSEPDSAPTVAAQGSGLAGRRILVIEDESMVTMLLQDFLEDIGCEVAGIASRLKEAREKIDTLAFDVAILDVNLNGDQTFPLAEVLLARGQPIVFATGYGAATLPPRLRALPVLQKPFQQDDLVRALRSALSVPAKLVS
jgi:CheY-like chemotaxis protein